MTSSLFGRELVPASNKSYFLRRDSRFVGGGTVVKTMTALNGRSRSSEEWVTVLEKLTLQRGLRFMTMLTWQNVLTFKSLSRTFRTWCPQCLEEQRERTEIVYEHLLWSLATVEVCLHHQALLETVCPHCRRQTPPFTFRLRPGHCSVCLQWLGHPNAKNESRIKGNDFQYEKWISQQMGLLIAAAPSQRTDPPRDRIRQFIPTCIQQTTGGNMTTFAEILGIDRFLVYAWIRKHLPPTDHLLKICHRFGVSFFDLVTKGDVAPELELNEQLRMLTHNRSTSVCRSTDLTRLGLLVAIEEDPPPTLKQVADRLGYKLPRSLYIRFPDLTKRLTARRRKFVSTTGQQPAKYRNDDVLKSALQQALEKELPPSLSAIAQTHGYHGTADMRVSYHDLCEGIKIRRAQYFEKRKNDIRDSLNLMLLEYPPPTTTEASERVGYKTEAGIRISYSGIFEALLKRYRKYRKAQYEDIRRRLKAALKETPPPPLKEMVARLGKKYLYLHEHFPEECQAVVTRYAEFTKKTRPKRKAQAKARMRRLALVLHERDCLTIKRLRKASNGPTGLESSELSAVVKEVKREMRLSNRVKN
jgi:AraC-like DNA-binding protein